MSSWLFSGVQNVHKQLLLPPKLGSTGVSLRLVVVRLDCFYLSMCFCLGHSKGRNVPVGFWVENSKPHWRSVLSVWEICSWFEVESIQSARTCQAAFTFVRVVNDQTGNYCRTHIQVLKGSVFTLLRTKIGMLQSMLATERQTRLSVFHMINLLLWRSTSSSRMSFVLVSARDMPNRLLFDHCQNTTVWTKELFLCWNIIFATAKPINHTCQVLEWRPCGSAVNVKGTMSDNLEQGKVWFAAWIFLCTNSVRVFVFELCILAVVWVFWKVGWSLPWLGTYSIVTLENLDTVSSFSGKAEHFKFMRCWIICTRLVDLWHEKGCAREEGKVEFSKSLQQDVFRHIVNFINNSSTWQLWDKFEKIFCQQDLSRPNSFVHPKLEHQHHPVMQWCPQKAKWNNFLEGQSTDDIRLTGSAFWRICIPLGGSGGLSFGQPRVSWCAHQRNFLSRRGRSISPRKTKLDSLKKWNILVPQSKCGEFFNPVAFPWRIKEEIRSI